MQSAPIESITGFGRYLRENGFPIGLGEQAAMVKTALALTPQHYRKLEPCWRSVVCTNRTEWERYPALFRSYWRRDQMRMTTKVSDTRRRTRSLLQAIAQMHDWMAAAESDSARTPRTLVEDVPTGDSPAAKGGYAQGGASAADPVARRAARDWHPEDLAKLQALAEAVAKRVRRRLTRRFRLAERGRTLDLRRTLRRSLKHGGLPLEPAWQRRRRELPRVFVLVDVSRSMELYAQLFLRVARAFCEVLRARVFVFHTRLAEVTPMLRRPSGRAMEKLDAITFGFGGGTRIASSLRDFAGAYARAALSRKSIVLVASDGYDTDPPAALSESLRAITDRGARVYWLHPTRSTALSSALEQAQPLVAGFAPAHDLASLQRLPDLIH